MVSLLKYLHQKANTFLFSYQMYWLKNEKQKYHTYKTIPKIQSENRWTEAKSIPLTYIYMAAHYTNSLTYIYMAAHYTNFLTYIYMSAHYTNSLTYIYMAAHYTNFLTYIYMAAHYTNFSKKCRSLNWFYKPNHSLSVKLDTNPEPILPPCREGPSWSWSYGS